MTELLLEIYSEEIPARMQEAAARDIAGAIDEKAEYYYTPQRIIVVADLPEKQEDVDIEKRGPKIDAPEQAVQGFLKSCGLSSPDEAEQRDGHYYFSKQEKGEPTEKFLANQIPEILSKYTWPKSMRWNDHNTRWVRPLHSILCVFGSKLVNFEFGHIKSGNKTKGHRFMSPDEFTADNFKKYSEELKSRKVIIKPEERKSEIRTQERKFPGHEIKDEDERLLDEVANLVEFPNVMLGEFDKSFLDIPQECLISSMKSHQKYFPRFGQDGKLTNSFIFVANVETEDGGKKVVAGNERVLRARLSDAKFFYDQDCKQSLNDMLPKLEKVTFHNKVGNMLEKAKRISKLSEYIANQIGADKTLAKQAGLLCKADLVSEMVGEFADLQGIMGGYYADDSKIGEAIKDHYKPQGQNDDLPQSETAICVSLADKLDSLTQLWMAGEKPTGSRDPFGLRRAALGIIRIILENKLKLSVKDLIKQAGGKGDASGEVFDFFIDRMKHLLKSQNIRHDVVDAVIGGDDLLVTYNKAKTLSEFLETDTGEKMLAAYNRAVNILQIEEKKDKISFDTIPEKSLLEAKEEIKLFEAINSKEDFISQKLQEEDYAKAMGQFAQLQPEVNAFFDNVMVNSDDPKIRKNRLKLLAKIRQFMELTADFSKIEG